MNDKRKELVRYVFFGVCATAVSVGSFALCEGLLGINELVANVISWILAVNFAYLTNRTWVFSSRATGKAMLAEWLSFCSGRLVTLGLEELMLLVLVTWLSFPGTPVKLAAQAVVLVGNYLISKLIVFKKK